MSHEDEALPPDGVPGQAEQEKAERAKDLGCLLLLLPVGFLVMLVLWGGLTWLLFELYDALTPW